MPITQISARDAALIGRMRILAHQEAGNLITQVVLRLPVEVQERIATEFLFVWPPRGESCSFAVPADPVIRKQIICIASSVADMNPNAQMSVIVAEIASAFLSKVFVPADGSERSRPTRNIAEEQALIMKWGFWK